MRVALARRRSGALAGFALAAAAAVGFGFLGIFTTVAYTDGASIAAVVAGRALFMVPLLGVLAAPARRLAARRAWRHLLVMAALTVTNSATYFVAVSRMSPAAVTLVVYLYPAMVIIASIALGRTRLGAAGILATSLTLAGVGVMLERPEGIDPVGVACAIANAAGYATYLITGEPAVRRVDALTAYAFCGGLAGLVLLIGALTAAGMGGASVGGSHALIAIAAAGLLCTIIASTVQLLAIQRLGSAPTALITCLEIVVVIVTSAMAFDEPLTTSLLTGALLITLGAALAPSVLSRRDDARLS